MPEPRSPTTEELPKMPSAFQEEVQQGVDLKQSAEPVERVVLPTAEDIKEEKTHNELIDGVESYDKTQLTHCQPEVRNSLPTKDDIVQERTHNEVIDGVNEFNKDRLSHIETTEENVLPTADDIKVEKKLDDDWRSLHEGVEKFQKDALKPTKTAEHFIVPKDELARNRVKDLAAKFDHNKLKKTETKETTSVAVIDKA